MVLDHAGDCPTRWTAVVSIAAKIGCAAQTLQYWTKKAEVDGGKCAGISVLGWTPPTASTCQGGGVDRPPKRCVVAMEACAGAHHWAREAGRLGHVVRLIPPAYVKP